jgi:hypothetical protein
MNRETIQFGSEIDSARAFQKRRKFSALKKVSGKLKRIWAGKEADGSSRNSSPRLLVVDDEESICFSMSEYFSLQGYKVDTANEIDEGGEVKLNATPLRRVVIQDLRSLTTGYGTPKD